MSVAALAAAPHMSSRPGTAPAVADRGGDFVRKNLVSSSTSASHKAAVTALAWSASGKRLATASLDGAIKVWLVSPDTVHTVSSTRLQQQQQLFGPDAAPRSSGVLTGGLLPP